MTDIALHSAPVTWPLANQIEGAKARGANGYVEFEASTVAYFQGSLTVLPSPQRAEVVDGVMEKIDLPVNDPEVWNWKVTPRLGVHWEPFYVNVEEGGTNLSSAAVVPGKGPVKVLQGPAGASVVDFRDLGDGRLVLVLSDGTESQPVPFATGPQGPANELEIGTVLRGDEPYASLIGEAPHQVLNLVLPKGDPGNPEDLNDATTEQRGLMSPEDKAAIEAINRPALESTAVARADLDVNAWVGRVGTECRVPTHDPLTDAGEAVYPSVLYFPDGWNGHRYWMAYTPYAGGTDGREDPCIAYSDDGTNWTVPTGAPFPLDDKPGSPTYNSDTNLVIRHGVLHVFWRLFDDTKQSGQEQIMVRTSADGVNWAPADVVYRSTKTTRRLVSPAFHWDGALWHMWAVDIIPAHKPLVYLTSPSLNPETWTDPRECSVPMRSGKTPWHFSVRRVGSQWIGLMNDTLEGGAGARQGDLLLMASNNGIDWAISDVPVLPRAGAGHDNLYKADMVPTEYGWDVWYSARVTGSPSVWGVFRTRLIAYDPAVPYASEQGTHTFGTVTADGGSEAATITFSPGRFTKAPVVFVTCNNGRIVAAASGISTSGATLRAFNWTTANAVAPIVSWTAIQQER